MSTANAYTVYIQKYCQHTSSKQFWRQIMVLSCYIALNHSVTSVLECLFITLCLCLSPLNPFLCLYLSPLYLPAAAPSLPVSHSSRSPPRTPLKLDHTALIHSILSPYHHLRLPLLFAVTPLPPLKTHRKHRKDQLPDLKTPESPVSLGLDPICINLHNLVKAAEDTVHTVP